MILDIKSLYKAQISFYKIRLRFNNSLQISTSIQFVIIYTNSTLFFMEELLSHVLEKLFEEDMSPDFDSEWETNGHSQRACDLIVDWIKKQVKGSLNK